MQEPPCPLCLSIEGVSTRFGAYQALDRIDLAINQGEFVALLGPAAAPIACRPHPDPATSAACRPIIAR